jgi:hypothetical protein
VNVVLNGGSDVLGAAELEQNLQIKPSQSVAVVNAPPESGLRLLTTGGPNPDQADVVIGFAVRPVDLVETEGREVPPQPRILLIRLTGSLSIRACP